MAATRTYAILELSPDAYMEIRNALEAAGYSHCFTQSDGQEVIDMSGIGLASKGSKEESAADWRRKRREKWG